MEDREKGKVIIKSFKDLEIGLKNAGVTLPTGQLGIKKAKIRRLPPDINKVKIRKLTNEINLKTKKVDTKEAIIGLVEKYLREAVSLRCLTACFIETDEYGFARNTVAAYVNSISYNKKIYIPESDTIINRNLIAAIRELIKVEDGFVK